MVMRVWVIVIIVLVVLCAFLGFVITVVVNNENQNFVYAGIGFGAFIGLAFGVLLWILVDSETNDEEEY